MGVVGAVVVVGGGVDVGLGVVGFGVVGFGVVGLGVVVDDFVVDFVVEELFVVDFDVVFEVDFVVDEDVFDVVVLGAGRVVEVGRGAGAWVLVMGAGASLGRLVCGRYFTLPAGGMLLTGLPSNAPIM